MDYTAHTHVIVYFANPFLHCSVCHNQVKGYIDFVNQVPECNHRGELIPCGHIGEATSVCPSWSPITGCQCERFFGKVYHKDDSFTKPQYSELKED